MPDLVDPLAPVRSELLAHARADAERVLAEADADVDARLAGARNEANAILEAARAEGESDAAVVLAAKRARDRRQARATVLAAQREAYDTLRSRVVQALSALRDDPGYGPWRDHLTEHARRVLGADAAVREAPGGGVLAEANGRRAAYTLVGLAEQVIHAMGAEIEGLWSS
jgi:vacuolar-type H+-ATPase subunit E/Vma4